MLALASLTCMVTGTYFLTLDVRAARKGSREGRRRFNLRLPSLAPRGLKRHKQLKVEEYDFIDYLRGGEAAAKKVLRDGINTLDDIADRYGEGFRPE